MYKIETYSRDKDGNRANLIGKHFYPTPKAAFAAFTVMKKLSNSIHLVPVFKNFKESNEYCLKKSTHVGYIVTKPELVNFNH